MEYIGDAMLDRLAANAVRGSGVACCDRASVQVHVVACYDKASEAVAWTLGVPVAVEGVAVAVIDQHTREHVECRLTFLHITLKPECFFGHSTASLGTPAHHSLYE